MYIYTSSRLYLLTLDLPLRKYIPSYFTKNTRRYTCVICFNSFQDLHIIFILYFRALSGFKADFGPLLGTSNSPAGDASENMKMDAYNLVDTLKRCGHRARIF